MEQQDLAPIATDSPAHGLTASSLPGAFDLLHIVAAGSTPLLQLCVLLSRFRELRAKFHHTC